MTFRLNLRRKRRILTILAAALAAAVGIVACQSFSGSNDGVGAGADASSEGGADAMSSGDGGVATDGSPLVTNGACGEGGPCVVFVTKLVTTGSFFGQQGGNQRCYIEAVDAGLPGLSFIAWLSNNDGTGYHAADVLADAGASNFVLASGALLAADLDGLLTKGPLSAIDVCADGTIVDASVPQVWTGSLPDGGDLGPGQCNGWADEADATVGSAGLCTTQLRPVWSTQPTEQSCALVAHLYCFQYR